MTFRVALSAIGLGAISLVAVTSRAELAADGRIRRVTGFFGDPPVLKP